MLVHDLLGAVALGKLPLDADAFGLNHVSPIHADPSMILFWSFFSFCW